MEDPQEPNQLDGTLQRSWSKREIPVNHCIYCSNSSWPIRDLNKEHVIPQRLGGRFTLLKASCPTCKEKIDKVETRLLRGMFSRIRVEAQIPRRKGRPAPTTATVQVGDDIKVIPIGDHPIIMGFPIVGPPGAILHLPPEDSCKRPISTLYVYNSNKLDELRESAPDEDITFDSMMAPIDFARLLAKIAHGFAVHFVGLGNLEPFLRELILGETDNEHWLFVGITKFECSINTLDKTGGEHRLIHNCEVRIQPQASRLGTHPVFVHIRLFAPYLAPTYTVVAGHISPFVAKQLLGRNRTVDLR